MEKRENPAAVRSKKALALALADLLMDHSITEITVADITDRAGLSRQTFYTNFNRKEDILDYSLTRLFEIYKSSLVEEQKNAVSKHILKAYLLYWYEHRKFLSMLFQSGMGHLFFAKNSDLFSEELRILAENAAGGEKEVPYIKEYLASFSFALLKTWITRHRDLTIEELTELMDRLIAGTIFE